MVSLVPIAYKFRAQLAVLAVIGGMGFYIWFLHGLIKSDQIMLDAAQDKMAKMTAEYRLSIDVMAKSIQLQNKTISDLEMASKDAQKQLDAAEKQLAVVRNQTNKDVAYIISKPVPKTCETSMKEAVNIKDLTWDPIK